MTTFDRQPCLTGDLIALRPARASDWDALFAVACDPLIWEQHPADDRWCERVFRAFFDDGLASGGMLVAIDRADGRVIGTSRYILDRAEPGEVEVGSTFLARSHWGGRYNGEMKRLMLDHAFKGVERVIFLIGEGNQRSRVAIERIGARLTDRIFQSGPDAPLHVIYAVDRPGVA